MCRIIHDPAAIGRIRASFLSLYPSRQFIFTYLILLFKFGTLMLALKVLLLTREFCQSVYSSTVISGSPKITFHSAKADLEALEKFKYLNSRNSPTMSFHLISLNHIHEFNLKTRYSKMESILKIGPSIYRDAEQRITMCGFTCFSALRNSLFSTILV